MSQQHEKARYRIKNWRDYNQALIDRGNITLWFSEEFIAQWYESQNTGKRGASNIYSDISIECMLMLKAVFKLPLRATQGFGQSLVKLMNARVEIPHFSTLSRRQGSLAISLQPQKTQGPRDIVVDSTGIKVYGEGEWKVRKHGVSKRRTWRKLHLAVDADNHDIVATVVTENDVGDCQVLPELLDQIEGELGSVAADGAYDTREAYEAIRKKKAKALVPPRKGAKIWRHGNTKGERHNRDENLRSVRKKGMKAWKNESGYHRRSLAETAMFRVKQLMGATLSSRSIDSQCVELLIRCAAINRMTALGMPESEAVL